MNNLFRSKRILFLFPVVVAFAYVCWFFYSPGTEEDPLGIAKYMTSTMLPSEKADLVARKVIEEANESYAEWGWDRSPSFEPFVFDKYEKRIVGGSSLVSSIDVFYNYTGESLSIGHPNHFSISIDGNGGYRVKYGL